MDDRIKELADRMVVDGVLLSLLSRHTLLQMLFMTPPSDKQKIIDNYEKQSAFLEQQLLTAVGTHNIMLDKMRQTVFAHLEQLTVILIVQQDHNNNDRDGN